MISAVARPAPAQVEVAAHGGVHVDRATESDRVVTEGGASMWATKGEASVIGARLGYWVRPALGLQLDVSRSSNESWFGSTPLPPPSFLNRTTYVSGRGVARTAPTGGLQLFIAAGPALMLHGGTGTNLRSRDTDLGGVLEAGARLRVAGRLGVQLALSNYFYGSRYTAVAPSGHSGSEPTTSPGSAFRHDLLVMTGLVLSWR
jgi:hypothetical protein